MADDPDTGLAPGELLVTPDGRVFVTRQADGGLTLDPVLTGEQTRSLVTLVTGG